MGLQGAAEGGLRSSIARNFSLNYPLPAGWLTRRLAVGLNPSGDTVSNMGGIGTVCMICIFNRTILILLQLFDAATLMIGMFIHW